MAEGSFAELVVTQPGQAGPEAGEPYLRAGGRGPDLGDDRPAGGARRWEGGSRGRGVLVIGAGGGVGSLAVQIANAFGAVVTGVCSTSKMEVRPVESAHTT